MPAYVFDKKTNKLVKVAGNAVNADLKDINVYSTEEKIVGTWIDGKPIYRRIVSFPSMDITPNDWNTINSLSIAGIDEIINARGKRSADNAIIPVGARSSGVSSIQITASANFGISKLIVEYTKTTD